MNNLNRELLVKAAKRKNYGDNPVVVDATAGLGEDSLLLAAAGFKVILFERNEEIADELQRLMDEVKAEINAVISEEGQDSDNEIITILKPAIERMEIRRGDSIKELTQLNFVPDIVYLDPMFPTRQKSGLVKKKFQVIHELEKPCADEEELLNAAIKSDAGKIIIKRPIKAEYLAGVKPSYQILGKVIRYDCIVSLNAKSD